VTDLRARKRLGQHFLHDPAVIDRIVAAIAPARDDAVIEIGGGQGALTRPLLERLDHLHVVETDPRLIAVLEALAPVHHADALEFRFDALAAGRSRLRIVGNLPYNISTPLLFHFLRYRETIADMHLMLQREVVDRMTASPGTREYGRLTIMLAAWTRIERCFDIGPGAFRPPPRVWSSVVRILPQQQPRFPLADEDAFRRLVALAFSMRRKTLRRILRQRLSEADLIAAGFDPTARPQTLSPAEFARLSEMTG